MIKTNTKMENILKTKTKKQKFHEYTEMTNVIWPEFEEINGCILINRKNEKTISIDIDFILKTFGDRTGFEATDSHVHMIDLSNYFKSNPLGGLQFAHKLVEIWSTKLKMDFPNYKFLIILSFNGEDSIVRFHRLRNDETPWIDINNLEEYKEEGIQVRIVG